MSFNDSFLAIKRDILSIIHSKGARQLYTTVILYTVILYTTIYTIDFKHMHTLISKIYNWSYQAPSQCTCAIPVV